MFISIIKDVFPRYTHILVLIVAFVLFKPELIKIYQGNDEMYLKAIFAVCVLVEGILILMELHATKLQESKQSDPMQPGTQYGEDVW